MIIQREKGNKLMVSTIKLFYFPIYILSSIMFTSIIFSNIHIYADMLSRYFKNINFMKIQTYWSKTVIL